jgi:hypothetical protein
MRAKNNQRKPRKPTRATRKAMAIEEKRKKGAKRRRK